MLNRCEMIAMMDKWSCDSAVGLLAWLGCACRVKYLFAEMNSEEDVGLAVICEGPNNLVDNCISRIIKEVVTAMLITQHYNATNLLKQFTKCSLLEGQPVPHFTIYLWESYTFVIEKRVDILFILVTNHKPYFHLFKHFSYCVTYYK